MLEFKGETNGTTNYFQPLLDVAMPQLYIANAFRVLGLPANATPRDLKIRHKELKALAAPGAKTRVVEQSYLPLKPTPTENEIKKAIRRYKNSQTRLVDTLFWFWRSGTDHDFALQLVKAADLKGAIRLWTKACRSRFNRPVAIHNLAVLHHAMALDLEQKRASDKLRESGQQWLEYFWRGAYKYWSLAVDNEPLWSHVNSIIHDIGDPALTPWTVSPLRETFPQAFLTVSAILAFDAARAGDIDRATTHARAMRNCGLPVAVADAALDAQFSRIVEEIKIHCATTQDKIEADPTNVDEPLHKLFENTKNSLLLLETILQPESDLSEEARVAISLVAAKYTALPLWLKRQTIAKPYTKLHLP